VGNTVEAAALVTTGRAAAAFVAPKAALLAESMVKAMFVRKLRMTAIVFLVIAGSGMGLALFARGLPGAKAGGPVEPPAPQEKPKPAVVAGAKPEAEIVKPILSLRGHTNRLTSVAYSPDGASIATASWDSTARIWDAKTAKEVLRVDSPYVTDYPTVDQVAFAPDNSFIVTVMRESMDKWAVVVWDRRSGDKVRTFPTGVAGGFALSPDGKWIACGGYQGIDVYELATGKLVRTMHDLDEKQLHIRLLAFAPDGKTLISTGCPPTPQPGDGVTRLTIMPDVIRTWDVATGKPPHFSFKRWADPGARRPGMARWGGALRNLRA
jgi:WD40 repeat protein